MKQLKDMPGICKYCSGCMRLELDNFKSVYRCKDFEPAQVNWEQYIRKELKNAKQSNK